MKKIKLNRFAKLNGRLTIISNIITLVLTGAYAYAIFSAKSDVEWTTLIMLIIPLVSLILTMHWSIAKYFNSKVVEKYNYQRIQDSQKLEKMFSTSDVSDIKNIKKLTTEISDITSQYQ